MRIYSTSILCLCLLLAACGPNRHTLTENFKHTLSQKDCAELKAEHEYAELLKQQLIDNEDESLLPFNVLATAGSLGTAAVSDGMQQYSRGTYIQEQDKRMVLIKEEMTRKGCL